MNIPLRTHGSSETGMTVIELIIAIVVTAILSTVILTFMIDNLRTSSMQFARQDLLTDARIGLDRVTSDIRLSSAADDNNRWQDAYAPGAPGDQLSWVSDSDTLVLARSAVSTSGSIIFDDPLSYITAKNNLIYFVSNNTLYKRILAAPVANNAAKTTCPKANSSPSCPADSVVMHNVSLFQVKYIDASNAEVPPSDARAVELRLTLTDDVFGSSVSSSYTTRMVFRNG